MGKMDIRNLLFILLLFSVPFWEGCTSILKPAEKELKVLQAPKRDFKLKIVYIPSNATIQSSIQVRKVYNNNEVIMKDYERYNSVDTIFFKNDSSVIIVLRDTISYLGNKADTMLLIF
ncbi:MAG: hypothetical protein NTX03_05395 [Bacteroidetes bacterium]|nr:hypothetical protein [Bacteroidota bacterium]